MGAESIITSRIRKNGKERQGYQLNNKVVLKNINLNNFTNNYYTNYDDDILKLLSIVRPDKPIFETINFDSDFDEFLDDGDYDIF